MKQIKGTWCLCLVMALIQLSCTSQLFIERMQPAEVNVENSQWKVVVINRFNPELLPYKREKKIDVYAEGAMHAFAGAVDAIDADLTYSIVAIDTVSYLRDESSAGLTPTQVQEIYHRHPHHLLLSLDHFDTYMEQEVERVQDEDGDVTKIAHYTLFTKSSWTLYDSTGTVLDRVSLSRDEFYNSRGVISGLLAIGPAISNAGPTINYLSRETGWDYWERLSPKPVTVVRPYYSNKAFAPAAYRMAASNWAEAIALLKPLTENQKRKEAAKAAYNLAVVYEAMGQMEEAKYWAKIASDKNNKLAQLLLPDLERY